MQAERSIRFRAVHESGKWYIVSIRGNAKPHISDEWNVDSN
jgi:hypothetical protein